MGEYSQKAALFGISEKLRFSQDVTLPEPPGLGYGP